MDNQQTIQTDLKFTGFLAETLPYIDSITPTEINEGGCGKFAQILAETLQELGIKSSVFCINEENDNYCKNFKEYLQNNDPKVLKNAGVSHVVVKVADYLFCDSNGINNRFVLYKNKDLTEITLEQLKELNSNAQWNPTFDLECLKDIESNVKKLFTAENINNFVSGNYNSPEKIPFTKHTMEFKKKAMFGRRGSNGLKGLFGL